MGEESWQPKLGDKFPKQGTPEDEVDRRFREVGFDAYLSLLEVQSPATAGDKSNEGDFPNNALRRIAMTTDRTASHETQSPAPTHKMMYEMAEEMRKAGMTVGIPIVLQLSPEVLAQLKTTAEPPPIGQDLGRFAAKAAIAGAIGFVAAVGYHWATAPTVVVPGTGAM